MKTGDPFFDDDDPVLVAPNPASPAVAPGAPRTNTTTKRQSGLSARERWQMHRVFLHATTRAKALSMPAVTVWMVLWGDVDGATGLATVAQKYVADRARCSTRSVVRAVQELQAKGLLDIVARGSNRHRQLSVYRIRHE